MIETIFTTEGIAWLQALSTIFAAIALVFSAIAVWLTVVTFRMKRGAYVRGSFSTASSVYSNGTYIPHVILENTKDRSVVIYGIFLKVSRYITIELETFDDDPLIIMPFEVIKRNYDPIDGYTFNMQRYDLSTLLSDAKVKKKLLLSTNEGKLVVPWIKPQWSPTFDWFRNHATLPIQVSRTIFDEEGKAFGGKTTYLVRTYKDGKRVETIAIYGNSDQGSWFAELGGSKESLASAVDLKKVFEEAISRGEIKVDRVEVVDMKEVLSKRYTNISLEPETLDHRSWFQVAILGRLGTIASGWLLRRKNHATAKAATAQAANATKRQPILLEKTSPKKKTIDET